MDPKHEVPTWHVRSKMAADGSFTHVQFGPDGCTELREEESEKKKPVEQLLHAVASCFIHSCEIAMQALKMPACSIQADVIATKAGDRPNRLSQINIVVRFSGAIEDQAVKRILSSAKRLCTVTNSMSADLDLNVSWHGPVSRRLHESI